MTMMGVMAFAQSNPTNTPANTPAETLKNGTLKNGTSKNGTLDNGTNNTINNNITPAQQPQGGVQTPTNPAATPTQQSGYPSQTQPVTQPELQQSSQPLTQPSPGQSTPTNQPQPLVPTGGGQAPVTTPGTQLQGNQSLQPATSTPLNGPANSLTPQNGSQPQQRPIPK